MLKSTLFVCGVLTTFSLGQDLIHCSQQLAQTPLTANIKGEYVNEKYNNVSIDVEWHHNPSEQDTFYIQASGTESLTFVTAGNFRHIIYGNTKAKRQIGARHLRENIGDTPMKFDDLELIANGWFQCPDSTRNNPNILVTAFPETQAEMTLDTLPYPTNINFKRWNDDRTYQIENWIEIAGAKLPEKTKITGRNFSGTLQFSAFQPDSTK